MSNGVTFTNIRKMQHNLHQNIKVILFLAFTTKTLKNRRTRRTTLTLEADVADYIVQKLAGDKGLKEKNVINDLIRKGTKADESIKSTPFIIKPFKTKLAPGMTLRKLEEMMDEI